MLSLARGEAQTLDGQPLDLSSFASELLQLLTLTAREARVTLESSIEPGLCVRASRAHMFTILFNLLKNAVEACLPGGLVSVHVRGDRDGVRVSVRDTGPGLDSGAKKRIFERYYTTKSTGTGLGLALVHGAVEASGARLEVDSEPGRGTVFRVLLPRVSDAPLTLAPVSESGWSSARASEAPSHPLELRVLVVDDDHALREMLATALSLRGADVISVRSSEEALELEGNFDIALIDMMLDDCRGDELLATLRQRGVVNAAMLVTGTVQKPRLVPGGEPDDWVRKPFEISHLVDRIRRTLERHRMLDDASQSARA
jgi:CheY-like chemotaxis protein